MSGDKDRKSAASADIETPILGACPAERPLMSGEALDDDALDELCDATLASIGETCGKRAA